MSVDWADLNPRFGNISTRLAAIEEQLALVSEKLGIPYERPGEGAPPEVVALVRQGKTIEALAAYRARTGASLEEARRAIAQL